jgi:hypothetical protein
MNPTQASPFPMTAAQAARALGTGANRVQYLVASSRIPVQRMAGRNFLDVEGFAAAAKQLDLDGLAVRAVLDALTRWEDIPGSAIIAQHQGVVVMIGSGMPEVEARSKWQRANPTAAARALLELNGFDLATVIAQLRQVFGS